MNPTSSKMLDSWLVVVFAISQWLMLAEGRDFYGTHCYKPEDCQLPDCYCRFEDIPGDIPRQDTPQMILFTYSGALPRRVREKLTTLFPMTMRNPNDCPVGITAFVVSQGSDPCSIRKMYAWGHEIGLSGINRTTQVGSWDDAKWGDLIVSQQLKLAEESLVDIPDISGMRAQKLRPGGDEQFKMIESNGFQYDSSLLAGPSKDDDLNNPYLVKNPYFWPYTIDNPLKEMGIPCKTEVCPKKGYPGVWEVPVAAFVGTRNGKRRLCAYLDDCLSDYKSAKDVTNLLKKHFSFAYGGNRAPMQINLQARTLQSEIAIEGIQDFIKYIMTLEDTWMVTIQDALLWVQEPTAQSIIMQQGFWNCPDRNIDKCTEKGASNSTTTNVSLRDILDVDQIWIWQTVILVVLYIAIYRYDKDLQQKKKK